MPDGADTLMGTKAMEVVLDSMRMNAQVVFWGGGDMLRGWPCKVFSLKIAYNRCFQSLQDVRTNDIMTTVS